MNFIEYKVDMVRAAEKTYKHLKHSFGIIMKEAILNSLQACIIEKENRKDDYKAKIDISINDDKIIIKDNGIGFNEDDKKRFFLLYKENEVKRNNNLTSKGVGRLSYFYYCKQFYISTIHNNIKYEIKYPDEENLFEEMKEQAPNGTELILIIKNQQILNNFLKQYNDCDKIKTWIVENFIFLIYKLEILEINIRVGNNTNLYYLTSNNIQYFEKNVLLNEEKETLKFFIVESKADLLKVNVIGQGLTFENTKLYEKEIPSKDIVYVYSPFFDEFVSDDNSKINFGEYKSEIQNCIEDILDERYKKELEYNLKKSLENLKTTRENFKSIEPFLPSDRDVKNDKIYTENDFLDEGMENKKIEEKKFWQSKDDLNNKLKQSSLFTYVEYRKRVIDFVYAKLGDKNYSEDDFHDLISSRSNDKITYDTIHNLWLIDDKFSYFVYGKNAKKGEKQVDILVYCDKPNIPNEVVLIELKKPFKAHNTKNMSIQVTGYAKEIYKKFINDDGVYQSLKNATFYAFVIANAKDIKTEYRKSESMYGAKKIIDTESSYERVLHIEDGDIIFDLKLALLSIQDLLHLAKTRNQIFFNLLEGNKKDIYKAKENSFN